MGTGVTPDRWGLWGLGSLRTDRGYGDRGHSIKMGGMRIRYLRPKGGYGDWGHSGQMGGMGMVTPVPIPPIGPYFFFFFILKLSWLYKTEYAIGMEFCLNFF